MGPVRRDLARRLRRGLSLIEVLVTLTVLSLAIGMIATLANQYMRLTTAGQERARTPRQVEVLQGLLRECQEARQILSPNTPGQLREELIFSKPEPAAPAPPMPPGAAVPPSRMLQVRYYYQDGSLWRQVRTADPAEPPVALIVAADITGFTVTCRSRCELELSVSYLEGVEPKVLRSRLYLWSAPP